MKKIMNENGFSIVEGMIGAGLLVVVIVGALQMTNMQSRVGRTSTAGADFGIMSQRVNSLITSRSACETLIGALKTTPPTITFDPLAADPNSANVNLYKDVPGAPTAPAVFLQPGTLFEGWNVQTIQIKPLPPLTGASVTAKAAALVGGTFLFPAQLTITAAPPANTNIPANKLTAEIRMAVRINGARTLKSCSSITFGTDQNAVVVCSATPTVPGCQPPAGLLNPCTQANLFKVAFDGIKSRCIQIKCPTHVPANFITGTASNGDVQCKY